MVIELQPSCSEFKQTNLIKRLLPIGRKIAPPKSTKNKNTPKKFEYIFILKNQINIKTVVRYLIYCLIYEIEGSVEYTFAYCAFV